MLDVIRPKLIHPELSYVISGILFEVHNELGRYCREKQFCDRIEIKLRARGLPYQREYRVGDSGNIVDFVIAGKIILEIKAKVMITKEDYYQTQRYLQSANLNLALLVNFRSRYLKPVRIIRLETDARKRFV